MIVPAGTGINRQPPSLSVPASTIAAGPAILTLFNGEVNGADAIAGHLLALTGDPGLLQTFTELFRLDSRAPAA